MEPDPDGTLFQERLNSRYGNVLGNRKSMWITRRAAVAPPFAKDARSRGWKSEVLRRPSARQMMTIARRMRVGLSTGFSTLADTQVPVVRSISRIVPANVASVAIAASIFRQAFITVVWSRPPKASPIRASDNDVFRLARYIAD